MGIAKAAAATNVLPLHATAVAMKTRAVTAMAGAQTTINNQLKAVTAIATETATMTVGAVLIKNVEKIFLQN